MFEFFLLPVVVWIYLIGMSITFVYASKEDSHFFTIVIIVIGVILYYPQVMIFITNWRAMVFYSMLYIIIGSVWSFFMWWQYCRKFIKDNLTKPNYVRTSDELKDFYRQELSMAIHISMIAGWIIYWPWSLVWNIIDDFINLLINGFKDIYKVISEKVINYKVISEERK